MEFGKEYFPVVWKEAKELTKSRGKKYENESSEGLRFVVRRKKCTV